MLNIKNYVAKKYEKGVYKKIEEGIYKAIDDFDFTEEYITSLSFVQKSDKNEGENGGVTLVIE